VFEKRQPKIPAVFLKLKVSLSEFVLKESEKIIVVAPDMGAKGAPKKKDNIEYEVHYRRVVTVSK
jgi:hypothetical protein